MLKLKYFLDLDLNKSEDSILFDSLFFVGKQ